MHEISKIDKEEIINDVLRDFFRKETTEQFMVDFLDRLQEDFRVVMEDFAKFIERRYDILNKVPEFSFMEALPGLLNGFYAVKEGYLKQHYEMLIKLTKEGEK